MPAFDPIYGPGQRDAVTLAIVEQRQGVKSARDAVELAAAGELENADGSGEKLAAFTVKLASARAWATQERRRRRGDEGPAWLAGKSPDEAIEALTERLVRIAANEVTRIEQQPVGKRDLDRLRKAAQVLREARALDRGDAPKQGSAQRQARKGNAPTDDTAASSAAQAVQAMRETLTGEGPHEHDGEQDTADGDTDARTTLTHGDAGEAAGGINGDASEAQREQARERERMARRLGIEQTQTESGAEGDTQRS